MADQNERSRGLTVNVDVDVTEALCGLKAIQREAKKATQALAEAERAAACINEIDRLASFIQREMSEEIGRGGSESAVDVAIRLLSKRVIT